MKLIKKIVFPFFSLFLIYRSIELVKQVMTNKSYAYNNGEVLVIALFLILFITGVFALPGFAYPTHRLLPGRYYKIRNPNRLLKIYQSLGLKYFRYLLLIFFWGWEKNKRKYFDGTRSGLQNFVYQSKQSEFGHLCAFVSITIVGIPMFPHVSPLLILLLAILNIIANLYPVILQRNHRVRIDNILNIGYQS